MQTLELGRIPAKLWLEDIEQGAVDQIKNLANLPFAFSHIAIMPDSHQGYGMPIGGVLATKDVIIPNAVGVDVGCGMCAAKTNIKIDELTVETLKNIMGEIRKKVPVGFAKHQEEQDASLIPEVGEKSLTIVRRELSNAKKSLGTLGGGNHFIEIQKGNDGHIWVMIHSGSRNLGKQVADHYNKIAVELNKKWESEVKEEVELAFLPVDTKEGKDYMEEMQYCVDFALANRRLMMFRVLESFKSQIQSAEFEPMVNIAHNYASLERHYGQNVWIHRKGATLATSETVGIIPGSQGTKSYIVKGKGNRESFCSCSHGAGRKIGRKEAQRTLNLENEIKKLDDLGVVHGVRHETDLDEASGAYKDIDTVMKNQQDLVEILVELTPYGVIKG